eukprot:TRINITY_DN4164_c0_g1_i1.p2 TRINITY_DN4164_c0_g1~~TRINITY_DN4164_c0_g1_i1.p2  ORF type:complete len:85 (-),score=14.43 TRINITY_DN4164_c0_g1_i1:81-335(-)
MRRLACGILRKRKRDGDSKAVASRKKVKFIDLTQEMTHDDFKLSQTVEALIDGKWISGQVICKRLEYMVIQLRLSSGELVDACN